MKGAISFLIVMKQLFMTTTIFVLSLNHFKAQEIIFQDLVKMQLKEIRQFTEMFIILIIL